MKRNFTLLLALLLLAGTTSCGGDSPEVVTTTSADETTAPEPEGDGLPEVDMGGYVFSIYHCDQDKMTWTNLTLDVEEQTGDALDDAIFKRNRSAEERFNFVIEVTEYTDNQRITANDIATEVMAGDCSYDFWLTRDYEICNSIPYLRPLGDLPYINLDAEWWFPQASEIFRFNGEQYGATSYFSLSPISRAAGFAFNEDMYEIIGADKSLYDYVREDKWTLDTFFDICKLATVDLNGDTVIDDNDRRGLGSSWKETRVRFINGSGVKFIEKNGNSYPEFTLPENETAINKMMRIFELSNDKDIYDNQIENMDNAAPCTIQNGKALFAIGNPNTMGTTYRTVDMNVGFVPCPKYDENQDRYYASTWGGEMMLLLKTLPDDRLENMSIILEALSYDSAKDDGVMEIYKEIMMKGKYAINENCMEMFDIVLDSVSFDFGVIAWEGTVINPLIKDIYASREGNVASTLAKHEPSVNGIIDTLIENIEGNIES